MFFMFYKKIEHIYGLTGNVAITMDTITAIRIRNVVVSTNLQGTVRATPVSILEKRGLDYSYVIHMHYGSRLVDEAMIQSLLNGEISFDEAFCHGMMV
jgi:hypothetical protein